MTDFSDKQTATLLQHFGEQKRSGDPVVPPIVQTSLFVYESMEELRLAQAHIGEGPPYDYSRTGNPTVDILEKKLAKLEGAERCRVFGSGMGAISAAILSTFDEKQWASGKPRHIVALETCYGPTRQFLSDYMGPLFGVETTYVDGRSTESIAGAIRENTVCVYLESPGSILFRIQDLRAAAELCQSMGIPTIVDNSYSAGIHQRPMELGIDMVVHSGTKYLAGHSDLTAGVLCGSTERIERIARFEGPLFGGIIAPFPAWLMIRGLRTLPIRVAYHETSAANVCAFLKTRSEVDAVNHIGDPNHPQRDLIGRQMTGSSGLLSFVPRSRDPQWALDFVQNLDIFQIGVSWGGFESLAVALDYQPSDWPEPRTVVRLYCGLEASVDLINDLERAFQAVG